LVSCLQQDRRLPHVPLDRGDAEVTVVAAAAADASTMETLRGLSAGASRQEPRFVLVVGRQWHADVSAAVDCGVRAVLWRDTFTPDDFTRTLLTVARGGGSFPPSLQGKLMTQVHAIQRDVLEPNGLTASRISAREADVLRLVAEGEELADIAAKLCYSERTVKYVLYGLMKRLELRNRAHAVSYGIRAGLI
jgi:DNA-binding NarL/FixJ family response regulator